jgi:RHS repeat-associated protein
MPLVDRIVAAIAIALCITSVPVKPARASWLGWDQVCPDPTPGDAPVLDGVCPDIGTACASIVAFRQAGGFPNASLRQVIPNVNHRGILATATCRIQRNPSSTEPFDFFDFTPLTCGPNEDPGSAKPSGCFAVPRFPKTSAKPEPPLADPVAEDGSPAIVGADPCVTDSGQTTTGDPVNLGTGNAFSGVVDFTTGGVNALRLKRFYNSRPTSDFSSLGIGWRHGYDIRLRINATGTGVSEATVFLPDGKEVFFKKVSGVWQPEDSDVKAKIARVTGSPVTWVFTDADDTKVVFNNALTARAQTITAAAGFQLTLAYDSKGNLATVTDSYGRQIAFTYSNNIENAPLASVTVPSGRTISFTLESPEGGSIPSGRLMAVTYPDATPGNPSDNPKVQYLYEDPDLPYAVTGIVDENGDRTASFAYDDEARATLAEMAGGAGRFTMAYGSGTTTVTNPLGKQAVYTFATVKNVPKVTAIAGQASANCSASNAAYAYDANGFLSSATDWNGNQTTWTKDGRGLPTSIVEAVGSPLARTTSVTWHATFRVPTQIVVPGRTTTYTYDSQGRMSTRTETDTTTQTVPYSTYGRTRTWTYTYDSTGRVLTVDGPRADIADVTTFAYSGANLTTITNALGHVTALSSYDARGLPGAVTDPNGVVTNLAWDDRGRPTSATVVDPVGGNAVTSLGYDAAGLLTSLTRPDGVSYTFEYDDAHRRTAVIDGNDNRLEYALDAMGGATAVRRKNASGTQQFVHSAEFDELGRLLRDIGAAGQTWTYGYDLNGNVTSLADPLNKVTTLAFDQLDRLKQVTDAKGGVALFAYDARDNLTSATDQRGLATSYVLDGFDNVIQVASPDAGVTVYQTDLAGNVTQAVDARGVVTTMTYDALGRMLTKAFPSSPTETVTYTYDSVSGGNFGKGRLTGFTDQSGSTAITYDRRGNVLSEARTISGTTVFTTAYDYTLADEVKKITYPSGRIVTYVRDGLGRVDKVTTKANASASAQTLASSVNYKILWGPMSSWTLGNGLVTTRTYDQDYRLTELDTNAGAGVSVVQDLTYGYDGRNDVTSITDNLTPGRSRTFVYDELSRLTRAASPGSYGTIDYGYDAVGNRTSRTVTSGGAVVKTYGYDAASNRLLTITEAGGGSTRTFGYDAAGNVTSDAETGQATKTLAYNAAGRLAGVTVGSAPGVTSGYLMNARGERVWKDPDTAVSGNSIRYHYDTSGRLLAERFAGTGGTVEREYVWLNDVPLARFSDSVASPTIPRYLHPDHLGTVERVSHHSTKAVVWDRVAGPFGELEDITASLTFNPRLPGQYYDAETGFHYNLMRDYDPAIGRYLQSDPTGLAGGLNTYAYVGGNPVNLTDPTGTSIASVPSEDSGLPRSVQSCQLSEGSPGSCGWALVECSLRCGSRALCAAAYRRCLANPGMWIIFPPGFAVPPRE